MYPSLAITIGHTMVVCLFYVHLRKAIMGRFFFLSTPDFRFSVSLRLSVVSVCLSLLCKFLTISFFSKHHSEYAKQHKNPLRPFHKCLPKHSLSLSLLTRGSSCRTCLSLPSPAPVSPPVDVPFWGKEQYTR